METMKRKALAFLLFQLCFASIMAQAAFGADVTLAWDPSASQSVAGYNVYFGTQSRTYGEPVDVGNALTCTLTGLSSSTYYFAVTAYDSNGSESAYSGEVSTANTTTPVISSMTASVVASNTATIYWRTNLQSDSQVEYGLTTQYGSLTTLDARLVTSHTVGLTGLTPDTTYHYRVKSKTAAGGLATSGDAAFRTLPGDVSTKPTVTIAATDNTATEAGRTTGTFTISRSGSTSASLTVYYGVGGTSSPSTDRNGLSGNLVIPAGYSSARIVITPVDDATVEGDETVVLTLTANAAYAVGSPASATVRIISND